MAFRPLAVASTLALLTLAACEVGAVGPGGGGDDDDQSGADAATAIDAAPVPSYRLAMTPPTASTELGTEVTYTVTVSATDFSGPVALTAAGAPASWTVSITPASVEVVDGGSATATVRVVIPANGDAATAGQALAVNATAAPGAQSTSATLTVADQYTVSIGAGTGTGAHWGAMSGGLLRLRAGSKLRILNSDVTGHRVHAGGGVFAHQDNIMAQGEAYTVTVQDGSDTFYCHTHGQGTGEVNVNAQ